MASVNFEKLKTPQQVKAMLRHCDREERKKTGEHSNKQIDKSLTNTNGQYRGMTYAKSCQKYDDRIAYLDTLEGQNRRKDRVTCFGLEIPFPEDLRASDEVAWINSVDAILKARYKSENLINLYVHRDEKHKYKDAETGKDRMSRTHIHAYVVPEIDGKLNGKAFSSKKNMISLNNAIQEMTQRVFGVDFMTGTKQKSGESVESLKERSAKKAMEQAQDALQRQESDLEVRKSHLKAQEDALRAERDTFTLEKEKWLKEQNAALEEQAMTYLRQKKKLDEDREKAQADLDAQAKRLSEDLQRQYQELEREKQGYKQALQEQAQRQVQAFYEALRKEVRSPYIRTGRAVPTGVSDALQSVKDKSDDFTVNF